MDATAEIRWFAPGPMPADVRAWFDALPGAPPAPAARTDRYLRPTDAGLGVKLREGRIELKRRSGESGVTMLAAGVSGRIERWAKWRFPIDAADGADDPDADWAAVEKHRRQRAFAVDGAAVTPHAGREAPIVGCNVECTSVYVEGAAWWTVCFEAHDDTPGGSPDAVVRHVARFAFEAAAPPDLAGAVSAGYPAWLLDR